MLEEEKVSRGINQKQIAEQREIDQKQIAELYEQMGKVIEMIQNK
jgi:hypothetical protein